MVSYSIDLPIFKGPYDLLLFFIERDELEITDIPISKITKDFLHYIHHLEKLDLEVASEFILVAATLMRIKAKMLLPRPDLDEEGNEIDPREELQRNLMEYKRYKEVMTEIIAMEADMATRTSRGNVSQELVHLSRRFQKESELESLDLFKLMKVYAKAMDKFKDNQQKKIETIISYPYTVEEQKDHIVQSVQKGKKLFFYDLLSENNSKIYFVFTFLAILELLQLGKIRVQVGEGFNNFWIFAQEGFTA